MEKDTELEIVTIMVLFSFFYRFFCDDKILCFLCEPFCHRNKMKQNETIMKQKVAKIVDIIIHFRIKY
jgi:hypothetical protein